jgi:hypothetical protein
MQGLIQQQQQVQQLAAPAKSRGSRKPWDAARFEQLCRALAHTAKLIGQSYVRAARPENVPKDAPDSSEYNHLAGQILSWPAAYKDLLEKRKKINSTTKKHNGGLEQFVYLKRETVEFINNSGVLDEYVVQETITVDDKGKEKLVRGAPIIDPATGQQKVIKHRFPVLAEYGGIGLINRALLTSTLVALSDRRGLKHPVEKKYIAMDADLTALVGAENFKLLDTMQPKNPKKKKVAKKESTKPKKDQPRTKFLPREGIAEPVAHFNFDAIPSLSSFLMLDLDPIGVTENQKAQVADVRTYLKKLTAGRVEGRKVSSKKEREAKTAQKVRESVIPLQVFSLSLNANSVQPAGQPGAGFGAFAPQSQAPIAFKP